MCDRAGPGPRLAVCAKERRPGALARPAPPPATLASPGPEGKKRFLSKHLRCENQLSRPGARGADYDYDYESRHGAMCPTPIPLFSFTRRTILRVGGRFKSLSGGRGGSGSGRSRSGLTSRVVPP